jgi:hypothetical protein
MEILGFELSPIHLVLVAVLVLAAVWWFMREDDKPARAVVEDQDDDDDVVTETEGEETLTRDSQESATVDDEAAMAMQMRIHDQAMQGALPNYGRCQ